MRRLRITSKAASLSGANALLVVAAESVGILYLVQEGRISSVDRVELEKERFTDNEGFSQFSSQRNGVVRTSAVKESRKQQRIRMFVKLLNRRLKAAYARYSVRQWFLFAPPYLMKLIRGSASDSMDKTLANSVRGNYVSSHPAALVELLQKRLTRKARRRQVKPMTEDASRILHAFAP